MNCLKIDALTVVECRDLMKFCNSKQKNLIIMISKKYLKTKPFAKVTFSLGKKESQGAKRIALAAEFNNWSTTELELNKNKSGKFSVTVDLEQGKSYEFRYVLDGEVWENDTQADAYVPNNLTFEDNSVVKV
ncbi:MAG: isoamylase early set domain-containing protein [Bacteroidota bacterium]